MTRTHWILALALLTILFVSACGRSEPEPPSSVAATPEEASATAGDDSGEVRFEPAYPEDVSEEGLSEEDVSQQEIRHSRGDGEEHTHGDGSHSHDASEHGEDEAHGEHSHQH